MQRKKNVQQPSGVATATELCMSKTLLSTPESTIMPSNAVCFCGLSVRALLVCVLCVAVGYIYGVFSWVFVSGPCTRLAWYLVAQYFSIAIFSGRKSPPFLYEVAIENARSKNTARKSSKSDRIR